MSQTIIKATNSTRPVTKNLTREWYILDASKEPLGRLATKAANLLTGKNRADYSQDVDMGAMVVIINSKNLVVTGQKMERKVYFRHSGRPGGLKSRTLAEQMELDSSVPLYKAIKGMLPKNRQQDVRLNTRLFIFPTSEHTITQKLNPAN